MSCEGAFQPKPFWDSRRWLHTECCRAGWGQVLRVPDAVCAALSPAPGTARVPEPLCPGGVGVLQPWGYTALCSGVEGKRARLILNLKTNLEIFAFESVGGSLLRVGGGG